MPNTPPNQQRRDEIIKILKRHGQITLLEIAEKLGQKPRAIQAVLQSMQADGLAGSFGQRPSTWHLSHNVAAPKSGPKHDGTFRGVDWSMSTSRPGCMDHLNHPSRRGDELVMHQQRMIHMASPVSQYASLNTKERAL